MLQLHGDARALAVEFLRGGQPDPAVAAGDKDMLVRSSTHGRHSLRLHMSVPPTFQGNVAAAAYQLRETRCAESLLHGAGTCERRSVELVTARSFRLQPS